MKDLNTDYSRIIEAAVRARDNALARFSNFQVGAAVETDDGRIFAGCNIESAVYAETMCAERVTIWKALTEGASRFTRIAVVADTDRLTPPCGACRQIICEFCGDVEIILANLSGEAEVMRMSELLPRNFDAGFLKEAGVSD